MNAQNEKELKNRYQKIAISDWFKSIYHSQQLCDKNIIKILTFNKYNRE